MYPLNWSGLAVCLSLTAYSICSLNASFEFADSVILGRVSGTSGSLTVTVAVPKASPTAAFIVRFSAVSSEETFRVAVDVLSVIVPSDSIVVSSALPSVSIVHVTVSLVLDVSVPPLSLPSVDGIVTVAVNF